MCIVCTCEGKISMTRACEHRKKDAWRSSRKTKRFFLVDRTHFFLFFCFAFVCAPVGSGGGSVRCAIDGKPL